VYVVGIGDISPLAQQRGDEQSAKEFENALLECKYAKPASAP